MKRSLVIAAVLMASEHPSGEAHLGIQAMRAVGLGLSGALVVYGAYVCYHKRFVKPDDFDPPAAFSFWLKEEYKRLASSRVLHVAVLWAAATCGALPRYGLTPWHYLVLGAASELISIVGGVCLNRWWDDWIFHQGWYTNSLSEPSSSAKEHINTIVTELVPATGRILMTAALISYILFRRLHMPS